VTTPLAVRVPAKINLWMSVGGPRADGFHDVATVYHAVSLYDEILATPSDTITVTVEGRHADQVPAGSGNIAARAAHLLAATMGIAEGIHLHIRKSIPVAAGLAGGSADAAGALVACDALWSLGLTRDDLAGFAAQVGSDVPFSLLGGTAIGTGRGEVLTPALARGEFQWVLATAAFGLSTPAAYAELDRQRARQVLPEPFVPERVMKALMTGNPEVLGGVLGTDFEPVALAMAPALGEVIDLGMDYGALGGLISGSGPTVVFLARDGGHAEDLCAALKASELVHEVLRAHGPVPGARVVEAVRA
jgi:4-diphosphocytidyl-2-C-methyl-D-erythritol kinase